MNLKRNIITMAVLGIALGAAAVPAKRDLRTVTQPDGTTIEVRLVGDEYLHYLVTKDGSVVSRDADGRYCYASVDAEGRVSSTGVAVGKTAMPAGATTLDMLNTAELRARRIQGRTMPSRRLSAPSRNSSDPSSGVGRFSDFPANGEVRALVLLVQYKDVSFTLADPKTYFNDMLNKDGFNQYGGTGSAAEYFRLNSAGQFRPVFDVYGPVTLGQNRSYYGGNDAYGNDVQPELMVTHALAALKDQVDLSKYDADNDGYVDNVYVFYAGQGEASYGSEETVWPHAAHINDYGLYYSANGKQVNRYATSNEWENGRPDGVGTFIHEFSHVLGLPDLYCTDYNTTAERLTPGAWSALDYGPYNNNGCTPPAFSVYERNAMGWIDLKELKEAETVSLNHVMDSNEGCIIHTYTNGAVNPNEFFLLENRQQTGWDKYVPGHGMLVWHIDYNANVFNRNTVNNTTHQYVDIVEACGRADNTNTALMAGYPFPGTYNKTSFTSETTPALKSWAGTAIDVPITNITEEDGIITFDVCGGGSPVPAPKALEATEKDQSHFVANWEPVAGATDYRLTVWAVGEGEPQTETADFGTSSSAATFPDGWTSNVTGVYSSSGNYGKAVPSLKMNSNGAYLVTRTFPDPIKSVTLWLKGQTATSDCTLCFQRPDGDGWENFKTVSVGSYTTGTTLTIEGEDIPAGTFALRIYYNKGTRGNVAIDDVAVSYGASTYILDGFNAVSTGTATSKSVPVVEGVNKYRYSVRAYIGTSRSAASNEVEVVISDGVEDVTADTDATAPVEYFNLQGVSVSADNLVPGIYIRRQGKTVTKTVIR